MQRARSMSLLHSQYRRWTCSSGVLASSLRRYLRISATQSDLTWKISSLKNLAMIRPLLSLDPWTVLGAVVAIPMGRRNRIQEQGVGEDQNLERTIRRKDLAGAVMFSSSGSQQ